MMFKMTSYLNVNDECKIPVKKKSQNFNAQLHSEQKCCPVKNAV